MRAIIFLLMIAGSASVLADTKSDAALDTELGLLAKPWNMHKRTTTMGIRPGVDPRATGQPFFQQPAGSTQQPITPPRPTPPPPVRS